VAVTGAATALLLLAAVVVQLLSDLPFLDTLGSVTVLAAGLLVLQAVALSVQLALAVAAALIAWRSWAGKARSHWPGMVVFSIVCGLGMFTASRPFGPAAVVGWVAIVLSGAALLAQTWTIWEHRGTL
jgi:hypothetical protein